MAQCWGRGGAERERNKTPRGSKPYPAHTRPGQWSRINGGSPRALVLVASKICDSGFLVTRLPLRRVLRIH